MVATAKVAFPGLSVGHAECPVSQSGASALVFAFPVVASVCVLGGAPGGRDLGMLAPEASIERVDALMLSGGSAFGLDAAGGAQQALLGMGRGLTIGPVRVPIVPQAIVFDLLQGGKKAWLQPGAVAPSPYWRLGFEAVQAAGQTIALGSHGAGLGATTADLKGGFGVADAQTAQGLRVQAFVVVNAIGSAIAGPKGAFFAAPYERAGEFGGRVLSGCLPEDYARLRIKGHAAEPATTIGAVVTDATLTKAQANRLAIMAHSGLARALRPAHAPMDGDTLFAAATGEKPLQDPIYALTELGMLAADCVARAVALGVYHAKALPGATLPDWQSRYG